LHAVTGYRWGIAVQAIHNGLRVAQTDFAEDGQEVEVRGLNRRDIARVTEEEKLAIELGQRARRLVLDRTIRTGGLAGGGGFGYCLHRFIPFSRLG
jgi:hypothetical protein